MAAVTFKGVFFGENCPEASTHGGNCPGVFLEGNFLGKQLFGGGKAIFLGSNCPGVGQISSGATFFVSNHSGELLVGVTFLGNNFPEDNHQGANCLGTTSPGGNDPETVINTVGQKIFFVIQEDLWGLLCIGEDFTKNLHEIRNWSIEELLQLKENADGMIMLLKDLNERSVTQLSSSAIDSWLVVGDLVSHALVRKRLINDGICDE